VNGDQQYITFEDVSGDLLNNVFQIMGGGASATAGGDASVTINGLATTRTSNTFEVNGVQITLMKAGGSAASIEQTTDTDKIFESIKTFVSDYNSVLKTVQDKYNESKDRNYLPLTDAQREELTDKQVEQWETKAKAGLLKNDSILNRIISDLRTDATSIVNTGYSKIRSLADIGIQTGTYTDQGKLYITNEDKLKQAIADNPEAVKALFLADISIDDSVLSKHISTLSIQMADLQDHLNDKEDSYYAQFTRMEEMLSKYQTQGSQLLSAFGGSLQQ
jgi:flagellar hook-associated protein 2